MTKKEKLKYYKDKHVFVQKDVTAESFTICNMN